MQVHVSSCRMYCCAATCGAWIGTLGSCCTGPEVQCCAVMGLLRPRPHIPVKLCCSCVQLATNAALISPSTAGSSGSSKALVDNYVFPANSSSLAV